MNKRIIPVLLSVCLLAGCDRSATVKSRNDSTRPMHIHRFDRDLFHLISSNAPEPDEQFTAEYAAMLKVVGLGILKRQDTQTAVFYDHLINYYSEPALYKLYEDALEKYDRIESLEAELGEGFARLHDVFPAMQIPAVYMHVSGFGQNLLVDDSLLSLSIDKYMGEDYPLYQDFFSSYQRQRMNPENVVADYLTAWLLSEYPFRGNDRVLLERMIYEGKIKYVISRMLPRVVPESLMGYTADDLRWCKRNEGELWRLIIERKHLYTPDHVTVMKYFSDAPSTFISGDAPGCLGAWTGWQIVSQYMKKTKASLPELMGNPDFQDILARSKYRPK
ncbi:MAG: gliding motility protein GldB [Tannerella sp.]|nr:gliding motility protein GldB [Tannerella sp.]